MSLIAFGPWTPDSPDLRSGATEALNVLPGSRCYLPFPSFGVNSTTPLSAKCQGAGGCRSSSGAVGLYAGDATKLYLLSSTAWTDASKVGGYSTDPAGRWESVSFGALAIFTNGVDAPQKITIDGGTTFADLGGSPPVARYIAVCRDYVILANLATDVTAAQWCATSNAESWPIGSGGGDIQPMPDCGEVTGLIGGDFFLALLERGVHRFDFVGGDIGFQRRQIGFGVGCSIPGTVAAFNDRAFFWHTTGFHMCVLGSEPVNIGIERVNTWFANRIAAGGKDYVFAGILPQQNAYIVGFNSNGASGFPIVEMMAFKWTAGEKGEGGWTHVIDGNSYECLFFGISAMVTTMEDLDVYGSMEAVPFPLDSPVWIGTGSELLGAFGSDHNSGWFNGPPMPATLTTTEEELDPNGGISLVRGFRPVVPGAAFGNISATVYARNFQGDTPASNANSETKSPNARGLVRCRIRGRYMRAEIDINDPSWTSAMGVEAVESYSVGTR